MGTLALGTKALHGIVQALKKGLPIVGSRKGSKASYRGETHRSHLEPTSITLLFTM